MHLFNPVRPEQSQGYSAFGAGLKDYQGLDRYREAEIYARLEDACHSRFCQGAQPRHISARVDHERQRGAHEPRSFCALFYS